MGIQICTCNKDPGNVAVPYSDFSLENNNHKKQQKMINNQIKLNKDSICLPNGNNMNSFFDKDNQNNQNDVDHFNISLSPITHARKNININIININNESSNNKINTSNNISSLNNINTDKIYDQLKFKSDNEPVKEESSQKEESNNSQENEDENENENENENESEKEDSKVEEHKKELIEIFDKKIKEFAEYISDEQLKKAENSVVKKLEESLDEISIDSKNNQTECFTRPTLLFKNDNSIYKGSWNAHGKKEGFGIFLDSKGNKYIGEWKDDKFNGKGRLFSIDGDYYEGYFIDGIIDGQGMYYSKVRGYKYLGGFKNYKFHGKGKLVYDNKMTYEGSFIEGCKEGEGKLVFNDGAYYEGNFIKNNFNGKGKFNFKDGRNYYGDWKNNTMEGKGVFNWGNGCKYNGDYKNNKKEGNGVYSFGCNLYDGFWLNNMPHGEGILLFDGLRIVGHFRYGKILEMKEGKGVTREMTQKFTIDSKANCKSLDDTNKGLEKSEVDSKIIKTDKFLSESGSKIEKRSKKKESKINESKYSKHNKKNLSKEKEKKSKNKEKDKKRSAKK